MIEPIGLVTVAAGLAALLAGPRAVAGLFLVATLLGASAAMLVGAANIQPAHFLLVFLALAVLSRREEGAAAIRAMAPPGPGFWLLCLVVYGAVSAVFLPRLLAGATQIVPLGTSAYADTGGVVPLGPVSSNMTQSVYMAGNLLCFSLVAALARRPRGFEAVTAGMMAVCIGNVAFALLDVATWETGTQPLLDFVRNARYTMHHQEEVFGLKRIVGSFPEASLFSRTTLGTLGFSATLWLANVRPAVTGPVALLSFALVVLSTSSAGLAGLAPLSLLLYATALTRCGLGAGGRNSSILVLAAPPLAVFLVLAVLLHPGLSTTLHHFLDTVVLSKADTDSGVERSAWNTVAWQNVLDTSWLGVGLGTARTSGLPFAVLANLGLPGTALYLAFLAAALAAPLARPRAPEGAVRLAARNGCMGLILGDLLVAPAVDQGLFFYALAALACAAPEAAALRHRRAAAGPLAAPPLGPLAAAPLGLPPALPLPPASEARA